MPEIVTPPCYLCGGARTRLVAANPSYSYVECGSCGYRRKDTLPTPAEEAVLYRDDYYNDRGLQVNLDTQSRLMRGLIDRRVRKLSQLNDGPGRLLDVGAGTGLFMEASMRAGWVAEGVDISAAAVRMARRITNANVIQGGLEDVPAKGDFDAVTMWDVLEHLADPRAALERVRALLRPAGLLGISFPNVGGLRARLLGTRWRYFQREIGHISHFSPGTLRAILGQAGFKTAALETSGLVNIGKPFGLDPDALSDGPAVLGTLQAVVDRAPGAFGLGENIVAFARSTRS